VSLEERYRRLLRVLPAPYRQAWEEDMVGAYLAGVEADDPDGAELRLEVGRPTLAEAASVLSLAVRLRLGDADAPPRPAIWGRAVRLATLAAVLARAVMAAGGVLVSFWLSGTLGWLPQPPAEWALGPSPGLWSEAWNLTAWCWVPAYVALVTGRRAAAQVLAALAAAVPALGLLGGTGGDPLGLLAPLVTLGADVVLIAAMGLFGAAERPAPRRWLPALPVGTLLVPLPLFALQLAVPEARLLDWPGLACVLVVLAIAGYGVRTARRATATLLALALLAGGAAVERLLTLPGYLPQADRDTLLLLGAGQAAAVLIAGVPPAVASRRALRRLPVPTAT
jgi:hypothetical protein